MKISVACFMVAVFLTVIQIFSEHSSEMEDLGVYIAVNMIGCCGLVCLAIENNKGE